ncbi:glycosyltransferase family 2 protein [Streptosporangium algeriense]|uniref:Glycosyltransferase family 2 protein n=1 Tax=Streptosporangium algeriense TaxID=1682748 RepID=A0ABW3DMY3_9ACTN
MSPDIVKHNAKPPLRAMPPIERFTPITPHVAISPTVSVVVPAMNEAENLPHVFATLPQWIDEIVLVDGNSVDDTVAVAKRLRPNVRIVTQTGKGKGDALAAGFAACTGDIIVMIDADGSTDGREIIQFVGALVTGADFVKGSRYASGGGSDDLTFNRKFGNKVLTGLVNRIYGTNYSDLCYGYNAFWARHLDVLNLDCDGFEVETLMNIRAAKAGLKVHEVPSHERCRIHGESNLHAVRDGIRVLRTIIREWRNNPVTTTPEPAATTPAADQGAA